ncbi:hypothetical protein PtA15_12A158 [Puccinia triticina]|uniref:Uncharacterized protein n=1 Tax=Puccinia triticina TaxID=208348 RepID=A0ABY7D0F4_9BASI|nr:uncharacterized protein PtA15_12A158 [Puccinia triticina]WAQ90172.1 hypothetical protein PtA15_12A158 [Puccinia triticina]
MAALSFLQGLTRALRIDKIEDVILFQGGYIPRLGLAFISNISDHLACAVPSATFPFLDEFFITLPTALAYKVAVYAHAVNSWLQNLSNCLACPRKEFKYARNCLPEASSKLPAAVEENNLSSPPLPKAEDNAPDPAAPPALPQLPEPFSELPAAVEAAPSSPPIHKAKDDPSDLQTAIEEDAPSPPPVPKAKEDALSPLPVPKTKDDAFTETVPEASSELPTVVKEDTLSPPPVPKAEDNAPDIAAAPALPQLSEAASELPTAVKEDAPLLNAEDNTLTETAAALPQLPEASSELLTTVEEDN